MTTILITLIVASWIAVAIASIQSGSLTGSVNPNYEPIAVPVKSQSTNHVGRIRR